MKRNYIKTLLIVIGAGVIISTFFYVRYPTAYQIKSQYFDVNLYDELGGDEYWKLSLGITVGIALIIVALGLKKEKSHIKNEEIEKTVEELKRKTPLDPNRDTIEKLCKELNIPFSKNTQQSGTASIRFINKPKGKKEE